MFAGKVVLGVVGAIVVAGVGNALLAALARLLGASPDVTLGLYPQAYLLLTTVGIVIAAVAWAVIRKWASRPRAVLRTLVPVVVGVSLLADVPLFLMDGASVLGVSALMLMHIVVAAVAVPAFAWSLPLPQDRAADVTA